MTIKYIIQNPSKIDFSTIGLKNATGQAGKILQVKATEDGLEFVVPTATRLRTGLDANKPSTGNTEGDVWYATDTDKLYVWDGAAWLELEKTSRKGQANGYCELDNGVLVPLTRIPATLTGKDADTVDGKHAADLEQVANKGVANGYASLNASSLVVQNPASKGQASGLAELNASSLVVQNPASKGQANGLAELGTDGKLPVSQLSGFTFRIRAFRDGTNQSIPNNSWTKVEFNTEDYDSLGEYDSVTNYRFTAQNAGYYFIGTVLAFATNTTGMRKAAIKKNASYAQEVSQLPVAGERAMVNGATILYLAAGDYVEIEAFQDSGASLDISIFNNHTTFVVHRLS
jgi:hypothetical protein